MPTIHSAPKTSFILTLFFMVTALLRAEEKPNFILVMADDQGWGDMGYQGHPKILTPHFDQASKEGLVLQNFHAAAPVCSPTRASVLTGRHPNRSTVYQWGHALKPQEHTLAEALKEGGYQTAHIGKWHLGSVHPGSPVNPGAAGFDHWISASNFYENDPLFSAQGTVKRYQGESSVLAVDLALKFLEKRNDTQPFFIVIWFGSPHSPHIPAEEDLAHYQDLPAKNANYYAEITGMDRAYGKLRSELRRLGLADNTLLWYTSDNGGLEDASSGGRSWKGSVYQGGLRVPTILDWPSLFSTPRIDHTLTNTSDIYPTLLDFAGLTSKQHVLDGKSLRPLLEGKEQDPHQQGMGFWDYAIGGVRTPSDEWMQELMEAQQGKGSIVKERLRLDAAEITVQHPKGNYPGHAAWRKGDWKLHRIQGELKNDRTLVTEGSVDAEPVWELYNLKADPDEKNNLYSEPKHQKRIAILKQELRTWLDSVIDSMNGKDYAKL